MNILQIFLVINAFVIGGLVTVACQHAYAHFHQKKEKKEPRTIEHSAHLPPAIRERLIAEAQRKYEVMLDKSAADLEKDLGATAEMLTSQLHKIGGKIVNDELEQYKNALRDMHVQADDAINGGRQAITTYRDEMMQKLQVEMTNEKDRLIKQIDTKLSDAVISLLIDSLQYDVDIEAQSAYLLKTLDSHKDELKKGVQDVN